MRKHVALFAVVGWLFLIAAPGALSQEPTEAPEDIAIDMANIEFDPMSVAVLVNTTVTWSNRESANHDVTGIGNNISSPRSMGRDAEYAYKFTMPGVYDYYCTIHSSGLGEGMWGRVIVLQGELGELPGGGEGANPEDIGVKWLAHWVGIISFVAVVVTLVLYYFVLKYGETMHATDHRDRKEP